METSIAALAGMEPTMTALARGAILVFRVALGLTALLLVISCLVGLLGGLTFLIEGLTTKTRSHGRLQPEPVATG